MARSERRNWNTWHPDLAARLALVEHWLADAAARGVHTLILPEYLCAQWLAFAPPDLPPHERLGWLADVGVGALSSMATLSNLSKSPI